MSTITPVVLVRRRIQVRGIVQGVGFRPFVYKLAQSLGLRGFVLNSSAGVSIEVEGDEEVIATFQQTLQQRHPPLARIDSVSVEELPAKGELVFAIRESVPLPGEFVLVSPDVATCEDCWNDVLNSADRRHGYPFTNCTNCGPRYTIIQDIPYDRPSTTMSGFAMCAQCHTEYHDSANRRFHAQPNACAFCGPSIALARNDSFMPTGAGAFACIDLSLSILQQVRGLLRQGGIVAIKGLGGFHLACDAENQAAVSRLRARKKRSDKPFALMARDVESVEQFCGLSAADRELLLSPARPIVILPRKPGSKLATAIAPGNNTVGVMLPSMPLQWFLFGEDPQSPPEFSALVMTSGNLSDEPIATDNEDAWRRLRGLADWFLFHNRGIHMRVDDSVARTFEHRPRVLRRSRGYAPQPIDLGRQLHEVLACGAELKNTFCLTKGSYAIPSQHIGDVDNLETLEFFQETLTNLKKLFRVEPEAVAYDLHPQYLTSRFATTLGLPTIGVQHHHAHIASCMAENGLREEVIGVAFDGTGYGTDGQIWGGEFMVADFAAFQRRAHLRYVPLAGGDTAVREVWRSGLSWLRESFGNGVPDDLDLTRTVSASKRELVLRMLDSGVNVIQTSSCGRLFDAVAAIIGLRFEATFEGQAAIELEAIAESGIEDGYPFEISSGVPAEVDMRPSIRAVVADLRRGISPGTVSSKFHNTVAEVIAAVCKQMRSNDGLTRLCLSGGTFQNLYLLTRVTRQLRHDGFEVFLHSKVPPNDGGISLGQAVIANERLQ